MKTAHTLMRRLVGVARHGDVNVRQIAATVDHWCIAKGITDNAHRLEIFGRMCDALHRLYVLYS